MKKWITTLPSQTPSKESLKSRSSSKDSLKTVVERNMTLSNSVQKPEKEENIYDNLENYRESPPTPPDSQGYYAATSVSSYPSAPSESFYDDPYHESGMFSGPVTDLDEDSDPDEIKVYNPATKTITIRKASGNNVNVNISVTLSNLEQDIQKMIDEMAKLDLEGSVRSISSRKDSGIGGSQEGNNGIVKETNESKAVGSASSENYGSSNRQLFWNGSRKWSIQKGKGEKDIGNVTCLVNENFDENRVFRSSVNGVSLGIAPAATAGPPKQRTPPQWKSSVRVSSKMKFRRQQSSPLRPVEHDSKKAFGTVFALTIAMMLSATAYFSVANVQSIFHADLDLGIATLMTEKASMLVCVLFIPTIVTRWPGRKWGCALGALLGAAWPVAQLLPWGPPEIFSAGAAVAAAQGLAAALLWGSALPLVAEVTEPHGISATTFALGALLTGWQLGQLAAGALTTAVLVQGGPWLPEDGAEGECALDRCAAPPPEDASALLEELQPVWMPLMAPPLLAALLLATVLRSPARAVCNLDAGGPGGRHGLLHPLRHLGGCRQLLLIPSAALSGMLDAFLTADFTKELSGCEWGGARAGLGPAVAGLSHVVAVLLLAPLAARRGARAPVAALCAVLLAAAGAAFDSHWVASAAAPRRLLLPVALAGAGAFIDVLAATAAALAFPERRAMAFSFLLAARAGGSLLQLSLSLFACLDAKLLTMGGALLVAAASTTMVERVWGVSGPPPVQGLPRSDERDGIRDDYAACDDGLVDVPLDRPRNW